MKSKIEQNKDFDPIECKEIRKLFSEGCGSLANQQESILLELEMDHRLIKGGKYDGSNINPKTNIHFIIDAFDVIGVAFPFLATAPREIENEPEKKAIWEWEKWVSQLSVFYGLPNTYYPLNILQPHFEELKYFQNTFFLPFIKQGISDLEIQIKKSVSSNAQELAFFELALEGKEQLSDWLKEVSKAFNEYKEDNDWTRIKYFILKLIDKFPQMIHLLKKNNYLNVDHYLRLFKTYSSEDIPRVALIPEELLSIDENKELTNDKASITRWAKYFRDKNLNIQAPDLLALLQVRYLNKKSLCKLDFLSPRDLYMFVSGSDMVINSAKETYDNDFWNVANISVKCADVENLIRKLEEDEKYIEFGTYDYLSQKQLMPKYVKCFRSTDVFKTYVALFISESQNENDIPDAVTVINRVVLNREYIAYFKIHLNEIQRIVDCIDDCTNYKIPNKNRCHCLCSRHPSRLVLLKKSLEEINRLDNNLKRVSQVLCSSPLFKKIYKAYDSRITNEGLKAIFNILREPDQYNKEFTYFANEQRIDQIFNSYAISIIAEAVIPSNKYKRRRLLLRFGQIPFFVRFRKESELLRYDIKLLRNYCDNYTLNYSKAMENKAVSMLEEITGKLALDVYWKDFAESYTPGNINDEKLLQEINFEKRLAYLLLMLIHKKYDYVILITEKMFPEEADLESYVSTNIDKFKNLSENINYFVEISLLKVRAKIRYYENEIINAKISEREAENEFLKIASLSRIISIDYLRRKENYSAVDFRFELQEILTVLVFEMMYPGHWVKGYNRNMIIDKCKIINEKMNDIYQKRYRISNFKKRIYENTFRESLYNNWAWAYTRGINEEEGISKEDYNQVVEADKIIHKIFDLYRNYKYLEKEEADKYKHMSDDDLWKHIWRRVRIAHTHMIIHYLQYCYLVNNGIEEESQYVHFKSILNCIANHLSEGTLDKHDPILKEAKYIEKKLMENEMLVNKFRNE